ncbi:MAG: hypothetical protein R3240_09570 [Gammaproteobacteria bacterium]|nr:hypothetical protein [Gammaproteobacteria bacterium]
MKEAASINDIYAQLLSTPAENRQQLIQSIQGSSSELIPQLFDFYEKLESDGEKLNLLPLLVELKSSQAEAFFAKLLNSKNEAIRALAAKGLVLINSSLAINACLQTINDAADFAHADMTPSVMLLADMEPNVLPQILPLLNDSSRMTRQHAQKVLELVTYKIFAEKHKPKPLSAVARQTWNAAWQENGAYHWDMEEEHRLSCIEKWKTWLEQNT